MNESSNGWPMVPIGGVLRRSEETVDIEDIVHLPPERRADSILQKEQRIAEIMAEIKTVRAVGA